MFGGTIPPRRFMISMGIKQILIYGLCGMIVFAILFYISSILNKYSSKP